MKTLEFPNSFDDDREETKSQEMLMSGVGKGNLIHGWRDSKLEQPLWKSVWRFPKSLKIELQYDAAIALWGINAKHALC